MGYCFSYPSQTLPDRDAVLLRWTKNIDVPGVVGTRVGDALRRALDEMGLAPGPVRVLNDTVAALLATGTVVRRNGVTWKCRDGIGLIVGTGTNMAAFFDATEALKLGLRAGDPPMAVNLESGNVDPPYLTEADDAIDAASQNPGRQRFEKAVSGYYLPFLFKALHPDHPLDPHEGTAPLAALAESGPAGPARDTAQAFLHRSADLVAASLCAVLDTYAHDPGPVGILAEGSLFWRTRGIARASSGHWSSSRARRGPSRSSASKMRTCTAPRAPPSPRKNPLPQAVESRRNSRSRRGVPIALTPPPAGPKLGFVVDPPDSEERIAEARAKLNELVALVKGKKTLLTQTHDFPDPDTIASALGLGWLLRELTGVEATIGYGGAIGRAENKAMIKVLGIKMRKTSPADFSRYDLVALLDTQPHVPNHCIPADQPVNIVFDHHFPRALEGPEPEFYDVGGTYGATSTKVAELIDASGLTPPKNVATALLYGIKSDTKNLGRETSPADTSSYLYLLRLADTRLLAEIEHPQVPLDYFRVLNKAIMRGKIHGTMIVSDLGEIYTPDLCAEIADRLLQIEGVNHALVVGWYEESLFLSLRTRSRSKNAGKILHSIVSRDTDGSAGGHRTTAGARISVENRSQRARADIRRKVTREVVAAFGQDFRHFNRVVQNRDLGVVAIPPPPKDESKRSTNGRKETERRERAPPGRHGAKSEEARGERRPRRTKPHASADP